MSSAPKTIRYAGALYDLRASNVVEAQEHGGYSDDPLGEFLYQELETSGSVDDFGDLRYGHFYLLSFPEGIRISGAEGAYEFTAAILEETDSGVRYDHFPTLEAAKADWESLQESYRLHQEHRSDGGVA